MKITFICLMRLCEVHCIVFRIYQDANFIVKHLLKSNLFSVMTQIAMQKQPYFTTQPNCADYCSSPVSYSF